MGSEKKKNERFRLSRRSFLKATGLTGIALLTTGMRKPSETLPELTQLASQNEPEGIISEKFVNFLPESLIILVQIEEYAINFLVLRIL